MSPRARSRHQRLRLSCSSPHESYVPGGIRQQRELARPFEGRGEPALVLGTGAGLAARLDLAALGEEAAQARRILVVDALDVVNAEAADAATTAIPSPLAPSLAACTRATAGGAMGCVSGRRGVGLRRRPGNGCRRIGGDACRRAGMRRGGDLLLL